MKDETIEEKLRVHYPECTIVETTDKQGEWSKFFQYFEIKPENNPTSKTYYQRIARPGYERFQNDHRNLDAIVEDISKGSIEP
jgi:hypothetical protein